MLTMTDRGVLFWTPRLLTLGFAAFLSIFAYDVFEHDSGFWQTLLAFTKHLTPVFIVLAVLVVAWRWEWIGAVLFGAFAFGFVLGPFQPAHIRQWAFWDRLNVDLVVAGPPLVIAALFLVEWLRRTGRAEPV